MAGVCLALASCSPDSGDKKTAAGQEDPAVKAKKEAQSAECLTNLKAITKAMRMWADAHEGNFPKGFILMSNELSGWKLLHCPGDDSRGMPDLAQVKSEDLSYKISSIGTNATTNSLDLVLVQCIVHGHVAVSDGTAVAGSVELQRRLKPIGDGTVHLAPASR